MVSRPLSDPILANRCGPGDQALLVRDWHCRTGRPWKPRSLAQRSRGQGQKRRPIFIRYSWNSLHLRRAESRVIYLFHDFSSALWKARSSSAIVKATQLLRGNHSQQPVHVPKATHRPMFPPCCASSYAYAKVVQPFCVIFHAGITFALLWREVDFCHSSVTPAVMCA